MQKLKIIVEGETINLCQPTKEFAGGDIWYKWINNPVINKQLLKKYRKFKNTKKKQIKFFLDLKKNRRKIFIISSKNHIYKGVVSLSKIDKAKKICDIALISDTKIDPLLGPYAGLEAIALISNYAFTKLKLKKIYGGGLIALKNWQQRMELIGFKLNDLQKKNEVKSYTALKNPSYLVSLSYEDFIILKKKRGRIWDNLNLMKKRISKLPKKSFFNILDNFLTKDKKKYYDKLFKL
jgi:hypothetical protein|tara:strand:- start:411 stop:1121 length:711 start_codon:yes stop_codon:yes gene_type:complete